MSIAILLHLGGIFSLLAAGIYGRLLYPLRVPHWLCGLLVMAAVVTTVLLVKFHGV